MSTTIDENHSEKPNLKHTINLYDVESESKKFSIKAKSEGVFVESQMKLVILPVLHLQHPTGDIIDVASFLNGLKESTDTDKYQILQFIHDIQQELNTTSQTLGDKVSNLTKNLMTEISTRSSRDLELQKDIDNIDSGAGSNGECPRNTDIDQLRADFDSLKAQWDRFTSDD